MKTARAMALPLWVLLSACGVSDKVDTDTPSDYQARPTHVEHGRGRTLLVISPHADDATLFIGGTIAAWADAGWKIVVARVTDDRYDSVALSEAETLAASAEEFREAMTILGVQEVVELGLQTDVLADASEVALRERIIWLIRTHRPYAIATIDPYSGTGEDNQDHIVVAQATAESIWTSQFDKHHPEHLAQGLPLHAVVEQWYFGRPVAEVTDVIDVSATLDRKIRAALAHETPMRNVIHQLRLQASTAGYRVPMLEVAQDGDLEPVIGSLVGDRARATGARYGIEAAEEFRVVRLGSLLEWFEQHGEPVPPENFGS